MKQLEAAISREFSRLRKEFTGKGALETQCRVLMNTAYIRFKMEYTPLEKALIQHAYKTMNQDEMSCALYDMLHDQLSRVMCTVFNDSSLNVTSIHSAASPQDGASYVLVVTNKNIERLWKEIKAQRGEG